MTRLFSGLNLHSDLIQKRHWNTDRRFLEFWCDQRTFEHFFNAVDITKTILELEQNNDDFNFALEPKFFNDSEHYHVTFHYHINEILL